MKPVKNCEVTYLEDQVTDVDVVGRLVSFYIVVEDIIIYFCRHFGA